MLRLMNKKGFTIVELIITITIMGILLTLAIVNVTSSQISARDSERKSDIETIALAMESYYDSNDSSHNGPYDMAGGSYPATINISDDTNFATALPGIDPRVVRAPGVSTSQPKSLVVATNNTQTTGGVSPSPTTSTYVYQPIKKDGSLCGQIVSKGDCREFNLYYRLEVDNTVYMLTSRHQ